VLSWLRCELTRDALVPSLLAEAQPHGHRIRSAAAASDCRRYRVRIPWRATHALFAPWRTGRPPTEHARVHCAVRTLSWCGLTRHTLVQSSSAEARSHGHRIRPATAASDCRCYRVQLPWHAARALIAPSRIGRPRAGQLATRSSPDRRPRLSRTATTSGRWLRFRTVGVSAFGFRGVRPARLSPR